MARPEQVKLSRERVTQYRKANKELLREQRRLYLARADVRQRAAEFRKTEAGKDRQRLRSLKWKYRLGDEKARELLAYLKSDAVCCAICERPDPDHKSGWQIDHCHSSGAIRGVLCCGCNTRVVAILERYGHLLDRAQRYLKSPPGAPPNGVVEGVTQFTTAEASRRILLQN